MIIGLFTVDTFDYLVLTIHCSEWKTPIRMEMLLDSASYVQWPDLTSQMLNELSIGMHQPPSPNLTLVLQFHWSRVIGISLVSTISLEKQPNNMILNLPPPHLTDSLVQAIGENI